MSKKLKMFVRFALFLGVAAAAHAQNGKVEVLGPLTDTKVSDAVRKALDNKGYRATFADGNVACEIWLRQILPARTGKEEIPGAIFSQLAESTLVGVISFPQSTTDYRGQGIRPGTYTLRYELQPDNGDHLGVSPTRDFLLLVPSSSDSDPDAMYKFDRLVEMSREATMTKHPAPLSMVQAESGAQPTISKDTEEHWVFFAGLKMSSGEVLPFGLVVKGTAPQ